MSQIEQTTDAGEPLPNTQTADASEKLAVTCDGRFYEGVTAHYYPVVFTDGACMGNGRADAKSGLGVAFEERSSWGKKEEIRWKRLGDWERTVIVVATDSEYVVKGMAEWLPAWKERGWRKADGTRPANLDLFLKLQGEVEAREHELGCKIKFWHVRMEYNQIADGLAKDAARRAANALPIVYAIGLTIAS
ncbi:hypothetical protein PAXRUDRAFT_15146 [Paxillus rubicundulus Ve08.2h10]|uniref:ribonuclease H n=1 Tax=Paxillus rubicundulus Ve08.2h10 TaxID=930991 RepID=A0A0D0D0S1_9AGAM|nr:hypothetical protein PAXRUDRAFT_15146 [Paxillus rubicundulus Ve08.2h10]